VTIPTRPVTGAATETNWGQEIHDAVFTPKGARVAGGTSSSVDAAYEQLQLNTAVDDPAGWLAADQLTVPAGAGRMYEIFLTLRTDEGDAGQFTRWQLRHNGTVVRSGQIACQGSTAVTESFGMLLDLAATDTLQVWAAKTGGPSHDVIVIALDVVEKGYEIGA
jgi:hypothetical protein